MKKVSTLILFMLLLLFSISSSANAGSSQCSFWQALADSTDVVMNVSPEFADAIASRDETVYEVMGDTMASLGEIWTDFFNCYF